MDYKALAVKARIMRAQYWRYKRLLFSSPAELRLIEIMGGKVWRYRKIAIVLSLGRTLRQHHFKREVRRGKFFVDYCNDLNMIIEVDGRQWHTDILADLERDIYIQTWCWNYAKPHARTCRILRISAGRIFREPLKVEQQVREFLA